MEEDITEFEGKFHPFLPPIFWLKEACPEIVRELGTYFGSIGEENMKTRLAKLIVKGISGSGHLDNFSFEVYEWPGLTFAQRVEIEIKDEEQVEVRLGKANIRIKFGFFGEIKQLYVKGLPEMYTALQDALKASRGDFGPLAAPGPDLKDACPEILSEIGTYFESSGEENMKTRLATLVIARRLSGDPDSFLFRVYEWSGLGFAPREEDVEVKLGKGNIRINFNDFGQINGFRVKGLPEMYTVLQNAIETPLE
ncbi:MAG: hypothetical protein EA357_04430 [Micavibrio sp.]|nr:MAG: hypothetical protein EA357_04430 [Micavibrio sp.]